MPPVTARLIRTARLDLRPLRLADATEMTGVLAGPALYAFTGGAPPTTAELRSRYQRWLAGAPDPGVSWCNWVIEVRARQQLAGTVQATITGPAGARAAEIAWVVGVAWQRRGIGREAAQGLVGWLRQLPVRTICAYIHPDHHASAGVARAAGLAPGHRRRDGETGWQLEISGP